MDLWWRSRSGGFPGIHGNLTVSNIALFISLVGNGFWGMTTPTAEIIDTYEAEVILIVLYPRPTSWKISCATWKKYGRQHRESTEYKDRGQRPARCLR